MFLFHEQRAALAWSIVRPGGIRVGAQEMTVQTINAELMLLSWRESSSGGASITLAIDAEGLEVFKALTAAKNGKGGQRFMAAFALLGDDETPQPLPEPKKAPEAKQPRRAGPTTNPKAKVAVMLCEDPDFRDWLRALYDRQLGGDGTGWGDVHPEIFAGTTAAAREKAYAKHCILVITGCKESRRELDTDKMAWTRFVTLIGQPWEAAKVAA